MDVMDEKAVMEALKDYDIPLSWMVEAAAWNVRI